MIDSQRSRRVSRPKRPCLRHPGRRRRSMSAAPHSRALACQTQSSMKRRTAESRTLIVSGDARPGSIESHRRSFDSTDRRSLTRPRFCTGPMTKKCWPTSSLWSIGTCRASKLSSERLSKSCGWPKSQTASWRSKWGARPRCSERSLRNETQ